MAQAKFICPRADFSDIGLHCHIVDGHFENIPIEEDNKADRESNPANREVDP